MNARVLIIVGMHRSCTSLVSQWLQRCGLRIGNNLVPGDLGNIQGHFEDNDFLELHKQFLIKRKLPWTGFVSEPVPLLSEEEKQQIANLVSIKSKECMEWGWKDPRTCLFLSAYNEALPDANYLVVIRGFKETVNSLIAREFKMHVQRFHTKKGLSKLKWLLYKKKNEEYFYKKFSARYLKIWIHYYEQILEHMRALPFTRFTMVQYSTLLSNDKDVFTLLNDEWFFSLEYVPFQKLYSKKFLSNVKDITLYIKDKAVIEKAIKVEKKIQEYFTVSSSLISCN